MKPKTIRFTLVSHVLLACLFSTALSGQTKDSVIKKIYLQIGGGGSSHNGSGADFGIQAVFKHNWTTRFSYQDIEMDPKNLPRDYKPGYTVLLVLPIPDGNPSTKLSFYNFSFGKCFEAGRKLWFAADAGLSIVNGEKLSFTPQQVEETYWLIGYTASANYSVKKEKQTTIGATFRADFNWAIFSFAGLGAGVYTNVNSIQSPVGFQVKLIVGRMYRKNRRH